MKKEIRAYLDEHRASEDVDEFGDEDSLLELGVIDSLSMVNLIAHLENAYGIVVDEDDMTPENFDSVEAIASFVKQKRDGNTASVKSTP